MTPAPSRAGAASPLSLAEAVCLALVDEGIEHGWAIGTLLAPGGDLGRVWTLSRPLTYRALDGLAAKKLIAQRGVRPGNGRDRTTWRPTPPGRSANRAWLDAPVEHVRDLRTEFLLKLALRQRVGLPATDLAARQRDHLRDTLHALAQPVRRRTGEPLDAVELWRAENARAAARFLDRLAATTT